MVGSWSGAYDLNGFNGLSGSSKTELATLYWCLYRASSLLRPGYRR